MGNTDLVPEWVLAGAVALAVVAIMVWQDKTHECPDGRRYTSGKPQPTPFHRRWCSWPKWLLIASSYAGVVFVAATLGSWWQSLLFITLPGAWFIATRPTTVDGPAMALAWASGMLFPIQPYAAVLLSCLGGFVHERSPVFAAIYALNPLPLLGLVASGWWREPGPWDGDKFVGLPTFRDVLIAHKPTQDFLSWKDWLFAVRGVVPIAAFASVSPVSWIAYGVAAASRIVGTDNSRFILWGMPPLIAALHDVPGWMVALHVLTFVRMF